MTLGTLLLAQILQIAAVASTVWLITQTIARKHAHLCFVLWLVVLLKCVTPPLWASSVGVFSWLQVRTPTSAALHGADVIYTLPDSRDADHLDSIHVANPAVGQGDSVEIASLASMQQTAESFESHAIVPPAVRHQPSDNQKLGSDHIISIGLIVCLVWLSIAALLMAGTILRAIVCVRKLLAAEVLDDDLQALTTELSLQLRLKRPARLLVTSHSIGPAVIGLFRPLIVIPQYIADRYSTDTLRPILAHELVHIRRGDLWVGILRHFAWAFWWFHPFVWKTSNALRNNAERCCDEEVIASLNLSAKEYARALVHVLELKRELKTIPVAPGVRPFDITSKRLERIMDLGQGSRQRTPLWCWAMALGLAVVSLPGAGLTWGEDNAQTVPDAVYGQLELGTSVESTLANDTETVEKTPAEFRWELLKREPTSVAAIKQEGESVRESSNVVVIRQDRIVRDGKKGQSEVSYMLELSERMADVLTALKKTGGVPEPDVREIFIHRRTDSNNPKREDAPSFTRISLLENLGAKFTVTQEDIILRDGDVMIVPSASMVATDADKPASTERQSTAVAIPHEVPIENRDREPWRVTLEECVLMSVQNGSVARTLGFRIHTTKLGKQYSGIRLAPEYSGTRIVPANDEISLDDLEINVRNHLYEVCQAYWELYFHHHNVVAARTGFTNAHAIWKEANMKGDFGGQDGASESQARAQYFAFKGRLKQANLARLQQESRLRHLLGVSGSDGRLLQPIDNPTKARVEYDWDELKQETSEVNPTLRKQRWRVRQHELQLVAAKKQLLHNVDTASLYEYLGLGQEAGKTDLDEMVAGDYSEWQLGLTYELPIGARRELTQLKNQQLQLRRAKSRLEDQELEVTHLLSAAIRRMRDRYQLAQTQFNALKAARDQAAAAITGYRRRQIVPFDVVLDAQSRLSQTEIDYFRALSEYQLALHEVNYRSGRLPKTLGCEFGGSNESTFDALNPDF